MKVMTNSWHYRLWKLGRDSRSEPRDLCRYFWHLALVKVVAPAVLAGLVLLALGTLLWLIWGHPLESGGIVLGLLLAAVIVVGMIFAGKGISERHQLKKMERRMNAKPMVKKEKEPSLIWEFLKARKRKVCPLIQVVDPNREVSSE